MAKQTSFFVPMATSMAQLSPIVLSLGPAATATVRECQKWSLSQTREYAAS
jgi:hypothetical protein